MNVCIIILYPGVRIVVKFLRNCPLPPLMWVITLGGCRGTCDCRYPLLSQHLVTSQLSLHSCESSRVVNESSHSFTVPREGKDHNRQVVMWYGDQRFLKLPVSYDHCVDVPILHLLCLESCCLKLILNFSSAFNKKKALVGGIIPYLVTVKLCEGSLSALESSRWTRGNLRRNRFTSFHV